MSAIRNNEGKARLSLVPPAAIEQIALVLGFGAGKYGDHNWRKSGDKLTLLSIMDSMERHLLQIKRGEDLDKESGLPHIAHVLANAAFIAQLKEDDTLIDDRYKKPTSSELAEELAGGLLAALALNPLDVCDYAGEERETGLPGYDFMDETED